MVVCSVGAGAKVLSAEDVPVALAGDRGVVRFTNVEDSPGHEVPILLPVKLLTSLGAIIDLGRHRLELTALERAADLYPRESGHLGGRSQRRRCRSTEGPTPSLERQRTWRGTRRLGTLGLLEA